MRFTTKKALADYAVGALIGLAGAGATRPGRKPKKGPLERAPRRWELRLGRVPTWRRWLRGPDGRPYLYTMTPYQAPDHIRVYRQRSPRHPVRRVRDFDELQRVQAAFHAAIPTAEASGLWARVKAALPRRKAAA